MELGPGTCLPVPRQTQMIPQRHRARVSAAQLALSSRSTREECVWSNSRQCSGPSAGITVGE